jgi:hypothetical protein
MNTKLWLAGALLALAAPADAQLSLDARYSRQQSDNWTYTIEDLQTEQNAVFQGGYAIGLGYDLPLLKKHPTVLALRLGYTAFGHERPHPASGKTMQFALDGISVEAFVKSYVFDRQNRGTCAPGLKNGDFFNKGFYIAAGGGYRSFRTQVEVEAFNPIISQYQKTKQTREEPVWGLSFETGLDIGLGRAIAVTPVLGLAWTPGITAIDFFVPARGVASESIFLAPNENKTVSALAWNAGLSVRWYFNGKKCGEG